MKSSNIADSVFAVNLHYTDLQNKTKELFFRCLDEKRNISYFEYELNKIWEDIDYSFMMDEITEYEDIIHSRNKEIIEQKNLDGKKTTEVSAIGNIFALVPISVITGMENKFIKQKIKEYKVSLKSNAYKVDKDAYLKMKVQKYTDQIVPYYLKEPTSTGKTIRYVDLSTYCSMIHNTNLTRTVWNQTIKDGEYMEHTLFYIPYHSFSCEHCLLHQNRIMTINEVLNIANNVNKQGNILHPNCKCVLTFYDNSVNFNYPRYTPSELAEQYKIRQRVNGLTLEKERVKTDIKIQKNLGNQDEVDKLNQQRNKINKNIRELKENLPTLELKKQVIAINR